MRVERLGKDKIKIFLTLDDLSDRGIKKEDLWTDVPKVHDLFNEIMEEAYEELGFELSGPVAVEIFALPAQGMVVIVSKGKEQIWADEETDEDLFALEVTLEESDSIIFAFKDFEDLIEAAKRVNSYLMYGGELYFYKGHYILVFDQMDVLDKNVDDFIALLSEYGEVSPISKAVLEEYGKVVVKEDAVKILINHFS
ncbi:genetic competence negative regulator [Tepidibacillus infernus]|uniref:Adaptor protein n=1 Tax=Tepidibacillus decaturensis TaxID=1413211 RepID=A0A135L2X9_9BACI|nr:MULTISPECIES: genetic competence negative regulator [Tepidibacillus]KXG43378.1 adaptor protein [Tepidibacillus decaturensis]GBF11593.1 adapter protein MecA 2 [Tepidibacillus sp. HK-1]